MEVSGGITILTADRTFLSCSLNLVLHLNLWFFQWVDLTEEFRTRSLNVCPSSSKNGGETKLFTGILQLQSPNSIMQNPSWKITDIEYWSVKSFPKINGVLMPLTTYASTLILMGPSGVWKYRSISTYPEMEASPVSCTKLTHCPCRSLMGVCISESNFCEIRVMLDPELIITLVRFFSRKLIVAVAWAASEPRKEHPGGRAWYFLNSTSGLEPGKLLEIKWWTLAISRARRLRVFWFKEIVGVMEESLPKKEGSRARSTLKELVSNDLESKG